MFFFAVKKKHSQAFFIAPDLKNANKNCGWHYTSL